jgi:ureidoacrylate peracid hydrolase
MTDTTYSTGNSALVLIDVLNDFLADDGKLAAQIGPMLERLNLKAHLSRLLSGAREAGIKVFYVPHGIDAHSFDDIPYVLPRMQYALDSQVFWKGSYGAEFYPPLQPRPGDVVISRHRQFDGFMGTDLEEKLRMHGIEKVVLAGLTSHTCVEGTGRHAMEAGFHVTFLADAVAEFTEAAHRGAIELSYPSFGHRVLAIDEFLSLIEAPTGTTNRRS